MPILVCSSGARSVWPISKIVISLCLGGVLLVAGSCRKRETYPVSGKVTFDGQAVSNGEIQFLPADHNGAPDAGHIENGEYRLQAKPGSKRVSIRAARKTEQNTPGALGAPYQDYIPAEFNSESTLTGEVKASDDNHLDFDLKTGAKP